MAAILRAQAELQGRVQSMAEILGHRQSELNRIVGERIDGMTGRIGSTLQAQAEATHVNLKHLQERLAVIDAAQANIQTLARDMAGLQAILSNKQTRGAFGQGRMEAIIADGMPIGAYSFQATLSNGNRPDCLIAMPNGAPGLVVDAKFPLEGWNAYRQAPDAERRHAAAQAFRRDMDVHIRAIAEKYLIPGETQETAFLFVPSESIFADLHESFEAVIQRAQKLRIMIVSPSLLMLSVQLMQALLKDQRMREQAHLIQAEVAALMQDLGRLDDRVLKLQSHFAQSQKDVEAILTSTSKISRRGERIAGLELSAPGGEAANDGDNRAGQRFAESVTGKLRLRVVDEE
nr:DNA recombination protein RmuC [Gellertiella hungarica]